MKWRTKRSVIFHPILFAVAPVLSLYTTNAEQILCAKRSSYCLR
jgi:hypothetical protein